MNVDWERRAARLSDALLDQRDRTAAREAEIERLNAHIAKLNAKLIELSDIDKVELRKAYRRGYYRGHHASRRGEAIDQHPERLARGEFRERGRDG